MQKRKIESKVDFIESLSDEEFDAGMIKFNIPDERNIYSKNGEGVWGWVTPEAKEQYNQNNYYGDIVAILVNTPLTYWERLLWGDVVRLKCHGENRPTLDPEWVKEYLK